MQYEKKNTCKINTVIQIAARQKNWLLATKARGKFQAYDKMKTVKKKKKLYLKTNLIPIVSLSETSERETDSFIHGSHTWSCCTYLLRLILSIQGWLSFQYFFSNLIVYRNTHIRRGRRTCIHHKSQGTGQLHA